MHPTITARKKQRTKTIADVNQLKHSGIDDEFRNSTYSNNVMIAMKKHIKGVKDPTI